MGIKRLAIKGDALLFIKRILGVWKTKHLHLKKLVNTVKILLGQLDAWTLQHVRRSYNAEAHDVAQGLEEKHVNAIKVPKPLYRGRELLVKEEYFLMTGRVLDKVPKQKRYRFMKSCQPYCLIDDVLL